MSKRVLIGRQAIIDYLNIDKNTFYNLVADGMPATPRGVKRKTWVLNIDEMETWSMSGGPVPIDAGENPESGSDRQDPITPNGSHPALSDTVPPER